MSSSRGSRRAVEARSGGVDLGRLSVAVAAPLLTRPLAVPRDVRLGDTPEGEPAILWSVPPPADRMGITQRWADGGTGTQAFWEFLKLAGERRSARFLAFARRFGVLGLWPYKTPTGHKVFGLDYWVPSVTEGIWTPNRYLDRAIPGEDYWTLQESGLISMNYEPVSEWRRWATWFRSAVLIGFELRNGRPGALRDWEGLDAGFLFDPSRYDDASRFARDAATQRPVFVSEVQHLFLKWSGLAPVIRWDEHGPALTLALGGREAIHMRRASSQHDWPENSLYPALVAQLLAVLTAGEHVTACSTCGQLHPRTRKARTDQPAYCDPCRDKAERARKRRWARKKRGHTAAI